MNKINKINNNSKLILLALSILYLLFLTNYTYADTNSTNFTSNTTNISINISDMDLDGFNYTLDCDDNDSSINPSAAEIPYDSIDQDCDGHDLVDADNDTYNYTVDCDDNAHNVNPGMTELLYNGIDDDCKQNTIDQLKFDIITSKQAYNIGEAPSFTVIATNNSNVNISISVPNSYYNYDAKLINQTYPISDTLPISKKSGEYTINGNIGYQGYTLEINKRFIVQNSINLDVEGDTSILENESISLSVLADGGFGDYYTYTWYFGDGATATGNTAAHKYSASGNYNLKVNAKDIEGNTKNKSIEVSVNKLYSFELKAINNNDNKPISDALITIDSTTFKTNNLGVVKTKLKKGDYEISAYKQNFEPYDIPNYGLEQNSTLTIKLKPEDDAPPIITIQKIEIENINGTANINFTIKDSSIVDCTIYTSEDGNWWNEIKKIEDIKNDSINSKSIEVDKTDTRFKIECTDSKSNSGLSNEGTIKTRSEYNINTDNNIENYTTRLNNAIKIIDQFNPGQKEVLTSLELDIALKDAQRNSNNFIRDLDSIANPRCPGIHCNITDAERQNRIDSLIQKTIGSINKVPVSIDISKTTEFVKYPTKLEIEQTIKKYFEAKNIVLTKKQLKELVEKNSLLQSKLTVSTKTYDAIIGYIDNTKDEMSLIIKELELYDKDSSIKKDKNMILIEDLNLDSFDNSNINFVTSSDTLSNSNLFKVPISEKKIIYYTNKKLNEKDQKLSNTLVISTTLQTSNGITGFAFSEIFNLKDINYMYAIIILAIIAIIIRLLIMFSIFEKIGISKIVSSFNNREYHNIMMLINDGLDYSETGDIQKASLVYKELKLRYEQLPKTVRSKVYDNVIDLSQKIDETYMKKLVIDAKKGINSNNLKNAASIYKIMEKIYIKLSDNAKLLFQNDIRSIHNSLINGSK